MLPSHMDWVVFIEFMAVIVSAIYGVLLATRTGMDFVGSFAVAFVAAFGGGTLRDLFLDRTPLFWIGNPHYPMTVFAICILSSFFAKLLPRIQPILIYPDAVGMALFTTVGTAIALEAQNSWFIAALLGTITGTFGGVLADVVCNEVPTLFKPSPLCATCAFTGAWIFILGTALPIPPTIIVVIATTIVVIFRLLAVHQNWQFPPLRN
jgi:uncharacterized membrane protein YeiH